MKEENRLDAAISALRQQLRHLDSEERQIERTRHRIHKALAALNAEPVKGLARQTGYRSIRKGNPDGIPTSREAVLDVMRSQPGVVFTVNAVAARLNGAPYTRASLISALNRLAQLGLVDRDEGKGRYVYTKKGEE